MIIPTKFVCHKAKLISMIGVQIKVVHLLKNEVKIMKENFSMYQIIEAKKLKNELDAESIKWVIKNFTENKIPDYQMASLLMAIRLNGMTPKETALLTDAMLYSGQVLKFNDPSIIDKHSTGGIGDKASFVLAPIAAAAGVKVPMIAGRGLGFTGGTVDKIECIPGFNVNLDLKEFSKILLEKGFVLIGQTPEIAPADKLIYALRDVTATIDSIPLITASIMSKKLAEGANGIVFDIKYGSGAFMKSNKMSEALAKSLISTGKRFKKKTVAVLSSMNQPLGNKIGHSLEILECIETLKGKGPKDLTILSLNLAAHMIFLAKKAKNFKAALVLAQKLIDNGSALEKLAELIKNQGGDRSFIDDPSKLKIAKIKTVVPSLKKGWIKSFQTDQVGLALIDLGGGRKTKDDKIDLSVGFEMHVKIGDIVKKNQPLLSIYHHENQKELVQDLMMKFQKQFIDISSKQVKPEKIILKTLKG
jgi:pyrimidine-nucleoside phosphorylase